MSKPHRMIVPNAQSPRQNENFVNTSKKLLKIEIKLPVVRYFTWKLELVSNIL